MQTEMRLFADIKEPIGEVDWRLVKLCRTEQEAMRLCIRLAKVYRSQQSMADLLGMKRGTLNTILNSDQADRRRYMSRKHQIELQKICGNRAIDQWASLYEVRGLAHQQTAQSREAELLRELESIRASR